jgi:cytochrome b
MKVNARELDPSALGVPISGAAVSTRVWGLGVRVFHWSLVAAVGVALVTGLYTSPRFLNLHLGAGAAIGGLIAFRILWGFMGPTYARFSGFPVAPSAIAADLAGFATGRRPRYLGHNPLGSLMVLALLAVLTLSVITGVVTLGGVDKQGPAAFIVSYAAGAEIQTVHRALAYGLLLMILGHLFGVAYESVRGHPKLLLTMVTGEKEVLPANDTARSARARPIGAALTLTLVLASAAGLVAAYSSHRPYGVPVDPLDGTYVKECGSCHFAYPPSLSPRSRWMALMDGLSDHFGEDASLEPDVAARIRAYLAKNSAETWDTRASHEFALANPSDPLRLTATPYWRWMHRGIPDAVFTSPQVRAKGACDACHSDAATGRFDPQAIDIPERAFR